MTVEGTTEEVEEIIKRVSGGRTASQRSKAVPAGGAKAGALAGSIKSYLLELREAGLFRKPQSLSDVKTALEAEGHIVPVTTLSGLMLRAVRDQEFRRIKSGKVWKYVNR